MALPRRLTWWLVFVSAALPSIYYLTVFLFNPRLLGVDAIETMLAEMGAWALRFLIVTLACSPLHRLGFKHLKRYRRMLGLYSFYYASLHLVIYVAGWIEFEISLFLEDVTTRPFIYLGMIAWVLLSLLAATSPKKMVKLLKRYWLWLHKSIYLIVLLVLIHLWMQQRASALDAVIYGSFIFILLFERLIRKLSKTRLA